MSALIYLGLGTNLGDRAANLQAACLALPPAVRVRATSPIYETAPWGFSAQPDYLNQVVEAETDLEPLALLAHLKALETSLGRAKTFRFGPRLIDLDILLYDALVLTLPELTIPHKFLIHRAFVLVPLADLAPTLTHPLTHQTITELLAAVDRSGVVPFSPAS